MQKFLIVVVAVFGLSLGGAQAFHNGEDNPSFQGFVEARKAGEKQGDSVKEKVQHILALKHRQERNNNTEGIGANNHDKARAWVKSLRSKSENSSAKTGENSANSANASSRVAAAAVQGKSAATTKAKIAQVLKALKRDKKSVSPSTVTRNPRPTATVKPSPTKKPSPTPTPKASTAPKATATPSSAPKANSNYPLKKGKATLFWVGEAAGSANGGITNVESAWDGDWMKSFGGYDDPNKRCGNNPCGFTPKENPFYFALPYNDLGSNGNRKSNAKQIPWYEAKKNRKSVVKNAWIEVQYNGKTTYGQWEDVGPFGEDDFSYVFGNATVQANSRLEGAGIDLSPAMYHDLGMKGNVTVSWRFVDDKDVPDGPWKDIVTTSDVKW